MNKLKTSKIGDIIELTKWQSPNGLKSVWKYVRVGSTFKSWKCVVGRKSVNVIDRKGKILNNDEFKKFINQSENKIKHLNYNN